MSSASEDRKKKAYEAHLFICTHAREGGKAACAARGAAQLRDETKKACGAAERGWKGRMRVNASGCLDRCEAGIAAVLYPEGRWFTDLKADDAPVLVKAMEEALGRKG